jgi:hypothetical protein
MKSANEETCYQVDIAWRFNGNIEGFGQGSVSNIIKRFFFSPRPEYNRYGQ